MKRTRTLLVSAVGALSVAAGVGGLAAPAGGSTVAAGGSFDEYASGPSLGYTDVSGHAQLVRIADGPTLVTVEIHGLSPETTYAVHVHEGGCSELGGHYFFDGALPDGDGPNRDEIWPGPVTTNPAGNARGSTLVGATAGPTASSIVVHATATGGARIACADLS